MNSSFSKGKFVFDKAFDGDFLYSMYEDDFQYIEEIFQTTLRQFDEEFARIREAYGSNDPVQLRRAVHKLKPAFGFAGMLWAEKQCQDFENLCETVPHITELAGKYEPFIRVLENAKLILNTEYERLKAFNS